MKKPLRIASFGFRSLPPSSGSAGADKFALEFLPRLVERGYAVTAYNRIYPGQTKGADTYKGVDIVYHSTVKKSGIDTLLHSIKVTWHIIRKNEADIVHMQGNNALFAFILKLFGKKVVLSIDGVEWERDKWSWGMRKLVLANAYLAVNSSKRIAIDNVFTREIFEKKFNKKFHFISFGSEVNANAETDILSKLGLTAGGYFLFVGRFIPDKGLQYLIPAFEKVATDKKLVLVGGSPNPSEFEVNLKNTNDPRIVFPGFIYGDDTITLMKHCYAYIQPSDIEGLSPVMLSVMGLGTPLICSDIQENIYIVKEDAVLFRKSNIESLVEALKFSLENREKHLELAAAAKKRILQEYSWNSITDKYIELFES
ncbi:MAG TPA: glycosyltransferase family 4 protein [Flavihumibacter sp.]|nr:glycosyltransferase family 4 protein [Bacteroidota bacterium]HQD08741.1 glycosyltransferase family 4 protein [Flavihumibacter sp.]